jgi:hypothetical protein
MAIYKPRDVKHPPSKKPGFLSLGSQPPVHQGYPNRKQGTGPEGAMVSQTRNGGQGPRLVTLHVASASVICNDFIHMNLILRPVWIR